MTSSPDRVEIRVHGVSGTPPADMLNNEHVHKVADGASQEGEFWQTCPSLPGWTGNPPAHRVEAYNWSKSTSGSAAKAMWIALLPFGLINASLFMLPSPYFNPKITADNHVPREQRSNGANGSATTAAERPPGYWSRLIARGAFRGLGIVLTAMFVLTVAVVLVDLIAWQGWQAGTERDPTDARVRVLVALTASTIAGTLLHWIPGRSRARYVSPENVKSSRRDRDSSGDPPTELTDEFFIEGDDDYRSLKRLHAAAGIAILAGVAFGLGSLTDLSQWARPGYWLSIVVLFVVVVSAAFLGDPLHERTGFARFKSMTLPRILGPIASALLVGGAAVIIRSDVVDPALPGLNAPTSVVTPQTIPGISLMTYSAMVSGILAIIVAIIFALALNVKTRARIDEQTNPREFQPFVFGLAGPMLAAFAGFFGVGLLVGIVALTQWILTWGPAGRPSRVPEVLNYVAGVWVWTSWLVALAGLALLAIYVFRSFGLRQDVRSAYSGRRIDRRDISKIARAWALAQVKFSVQWVILTFAVVGLAMALWIVVHIAISGLVLTSATNGCPEPAGVDHILFPELTRCAGGSGVLVVIVISLVVLTFLASAKPNVRRAFNIVWDIFAFWPAAAHPLVPPPYAWKAIEDLRMRIADYLGGMLSDGHTAIPPPTCGRPDLHVPASGRVRTVLLATHSQGSLIGVATLVRLPADMQDNVGILAFGSQLQILFSRAFPAYVNFAFLGWLHNRLPGRFYNIFRETDPLAGRVLSWDRDRDGAPSPPRDPLQSRSFQSDGGKCDDAVCARGVRRSGTDLRLLDPTIEDLAARRMVMLKHSDYFADPAWKDVVDTIFSSAEEYGTADESPAQPQDGPLRIT